MDERAAQSTGEPVRVLIIDDSAVVRQALRTGLSKHADIDVVGVARDPYDARDQIARLKPDVLTLDIEMPRMNGLSFLRRLKKYHPIPTIIVSSVAPRGCELAIKCLEAGALNVVSKPSVCVQTDEMIDTLAELVRWAGREDVRSSIVRARAHSSSAMESGQRAAPPCRIAHAPDARKIIAIGASTGGTEALSQILPRLPRQSPGLLLVQHMPPGFTSSFAARLNELSVIDVKEAEDGDRIEPGTAILADGSRHLKLARDGRGYVARVLDGPKVCGHKPSVEVLFESVARTAGAQGLGILLTGMGKDGAQAMRSLFDAGAMTICQNEATSVVFGMPREAIELGGARLVTPLEAIADQIVGWATGQLASRGAA